MAEPVLIYAYDDAEKGVPLSDEDVARGHLEDGWVPVVSCYACDSAIPADAPTGSITFFECVWQLTRLPCGEWMYGRGTMRKTRLLLEEDEELTIEPLGALCEHMVIMCKARPHVFIMTSLVGVYTERGLRFIGHPFHFASVEEYDSFVVCKQPRVPFVLK